MAEPVRLLIAWALAARSSLSQGQIAVPGWSLNTATNLFAAEIEATPVDGSWVIKFANRSTDVLVGSFSLQLAGEGNFASPCRLVATTGEAPGRRIEKVGGEQQGARLDSSFPGAPLIDAIAIELPPRGLMIWTAKVEPCAPEDLDGDGNVGSSDVAIVLGAWGAQQLIPDVDRDGDVDAADLARIHAAWSGTG